MTESFADLLDAQLAQLNLKPGTLVEGKIISMEGDYATVAAGLKSEGVVPLSEFKLPDGDYEIEEGDTIEFMLETIEDGYGETRLSREKARRLEAWSVLEQSFEAGDIIMGEITDRVKGGFTVDLGVVTAFLPGSLIDVRPVRDTNYLENRPLEFKIVKMDVQRNNIVVSRRAVVEAESDAEREELLENLEDGQILDGVVKNLTDYGAFVDLGGIDGLLHITDMAWKRVKHPSDMIEVGQTLKVKVLKFDKEKNRVSLGLKQLAEDPWQNVARRYPAMTRLFGTVTNITDYGCFVEIEDGIEGLVHMSEMDWTNKNVHPGKLVQVGTEVEVMVLEIDEKRRRISLGIKQCIANPWEDFANNYRKDDKVKGTIKSITDFGIFVGLEGNIDGLIHLSDLSWGDDAETMLRNFNKGDEVQAVVISIDPARERVSLGIKQLEADPFADYLAEHPRGSAIEVTVKAIEDRSIVVDLAPEVQGYIRASEFDAELQAGEELKVFVHGFDKKNNGIYLSVKEPSQERSKPKSNRDNADDEELGGTLLGDMLREQISNREA